MNSATPVAAKSSHERQSEGRKRVGSSGPARRYLPLAASRVDSEMAFELAEVPCAASRIGWCTRMYRSADAGRSWRRIDAPRLSANDEHGRLLFVSPKVGWLIAGPYERPWKAWSTADAGAAWRQVRIPPPTDISATDGIVYFATQRGIYFQRYGGRGPHWAGAAVGTALAVTGDSVINYPELSKTRAGVSRMVLVRRGHARSHRLPCRGQMSSALTETFRGRLLLACGGEGGTGEQLKRAYLSADHGRTWRHVGDPPVVGYVALAAMSSRGVFITGGRMPIYRSGDDGRTWHDVAAVNASGDGYTGLGFAARRFGWANCDDDLNSLYFTDDAGRTWYHPAHP